MEEEVGEGLIEMLDVDWTMGSKTLAKSFESMRVDVESEPAEADESLNSFLTLNLLLLVEGGLTTSAESPRFSSIALALEEAKTEMFMITNRAKSSVEFAGHRGEDMEVVDEEDVEEDELW